MKEKISIATQLEWKLKKKKKLGCRKKFFNKSARNCMICPSMHEVSEKITQSNVK